MLSFLIRYLVANRSRTFLLILGVLIVSSAFLLLTSASETTVVAVDEELAQYWRTTYDILVRPAGTRSNIENEYGLVQANYLSNIPGGITFEQYKAVKSIPGVEVAAPIAMLGYVPLDFSYEFDAPPPGVYDQFKKTTVKTGISTLIQESHSFSWVENAEAGEESDSAQFKDFWQQFGMNLQRRQPGLIYSDEYWFQVPFLIAGIDPEQEANLIGLDQVIIDGDYLPGNVPIYEYPPPSFTGTDCANCYEWVGNLSTFQIPVLFNIHNYSDVTMEMALHQLALTQSAETLAMIAANGKQTFLKTVPISKTLAAEIKTAEELYWKLLAELPTDAYTDMKQSLQELAAQDPELKDLLEGIGSPPSQLLFPLVSSVTYQEHTNLNGTVGPVLEAIPQRVGENNITNRNMLRPWEMPEAEFRTLPEQPYAEIAPVWVGSFDIEELVAVGNNLTSVPLETYFPPQITLRYNASGQSVEPSTLSPTLNPAGYIQQPPLLLTTLETAQAIQGDDCISAIRVRVAGIDGYTPATQNKIEAVAAEIIRLTGLDVDVVVGSSPRRLLVYLPGINDIPPIGYVEEPWVQKGVTLNISQKTEQGNILLFSTMLAVCTLYILNTSMASTLGRVAEFGLLKSFGWRNSTLVWLVLGQVAIVGLLAGVLGSGLAIGGAHILNLNLLPEQTILVIPLSLALCLLGSLFPALWATGVAPTYATRQGEIAPLSPPSLRWQNYSIQSLWRRRVRSLLSILTMSLSASLLVLIVCSLVSLNGYMNLTLLGEYILIRIQGYHYVMLGVCLLVAAISVADILLLGLFERRREVGLLKAVGWRTGSIAQLFLIDGLLLGILGGLAGTILGLGIYVYIYHSLNPEMAWGALAGILIPALVGMLAALYPAWRAARVAPAESIRYE